MLNLPGGVTGVGKAWIATGWRAARVTDQDDPWAVLGASVIPEPGAVSAGSGIGEIPGTAGGFPGGIGLTGDGGPVNPGAFNRDWINAQISSGKKITDIGQELNSPFHQLEKKAVDGYPGYSQDIQENGGLRTVDTLRREQL